MCPTAIGHAINNNKEITMESSDTIPTVDQLQKYIKSFFECDQKFKSLESQSNTADFGILLLEKLLIQLKSFESTNPFEV
jgi:hypothetical protein